MSSLVVFGLSISSSWGNGHATTYRGLLAALANLGWQVTFFERDVPWYRDHRDLPRPAFCDLHLYDSFAEARLEAEAAVARADAVLVGSYTDPAIVDWSACQNRPLLYYDIDTPITLTALAAGSCDYLRADQLPRIDEYFSFTGGPALDVLRDRWGVRRASVLYCGVDPAAHHPVDPDNRFRAALSYMGTYAADRQPKLEALFLAAADRRPADRFLLAGAQYPPLALPPNVAHLDHVAPPDHAALYSSGATLNLTRAAMVRYGWSPSVRLFEAAACGSCILSDCWPGIETLLVPGEEILLVKSTADVLDALALPPDRRAAIGEAARRRILADHTYDRRAEALLAVIERA